jgi:prophage tail gpP-like protein
VGAGANRRNIHVTRYGPETGPVFNFTFGHESPWIKLINAADNQGYIFTSNEAGNLYIWRVAEGVRRERYFLTEGQNIREIQYIENGAEQYHEYLIRAAGREGRAIDNTCKNGRKLWLNLTDPVIDPGSLDRRAKTEMLRRRENRTLVTVTGWGLTNQQIRALETTHKKEIFWNPNFLIPVKIPSLGFSDKLLISQVEHTAEPSKMTTVITLVHEDAYS